MTTGTALNTLATALSGRAGQCWRLRDFSLENRGKDFLTEAAQHEIASALFELAAAVCLVADEITGKDGAKPPEVEP